MKGKLKKMLAGIMGVFLGITIGITFFPQTTINAYAEYENDNPIRVVNDGFVYGFIGHQMDRVWFGSYKQGKYENGEYLTEPIEWGNIELKDGKLYLLAAQNLDVVRYNDEDVEISYKDSLIRNWLNGSLDGQFLKNAFSKQEQAAITDTPIGKDADGEVFYDKVFLLSEDEEENPDYWGGDTYYSYQEDFYKRFHGAKNTAYVADGGSLGKNRMAAEGETDSWWIRASHDGRSAPIVDENGLLVRDSVVVSDSAVAVRPAIKINLSEVLLISAPDEYTKQCIEVGPDTLVNYIRSYYNMGHEWKLTLIDHDRDFTAVRVGDGDVEAGSRIKVAYSGAILGENEYVSVILMDSMGNFLSYGRIVDNSVSEAAESGTAELTIPSDLSGQDVVIKVYSEQVNSEKMTDYASAFSSINIRVKPDESVETSALDIKWYNVEGKSYWYENGVRQGTYEDKNGVLGVDPATGIATKRGREIYDPGTVSWYWLDSCYDGAKAVNKEVWIPYVFQNEAEWSNEEIDRIATEADYGKDGLGDCVRNAIINREGKWVRYDSYGRMMKGWVTIEGSLANLYPSEAGNIYYYDYLTGMMAKGWVSMDYVNYHFDENTGVLLEQSDYFGPK